MTPVRDRSRRSSNVYRRPGLTDGWVGGFLLGLGLDPDASVDLGGTMSLNIHVPGSGLVVRVHPPFVSRSRLSRLRTLRRYLAEVGLVVGVPQRLGRDDVVEVGEYLVEAETFVTHTKPEPTWEAYRWMYGAMGKLHKALATAPLSVPRPAVSTYGPPSSLRRWLAHTTAAVAHDGEAAAITAWAADMTRKLETRWIPASQLPVHTVHGDIRLGNVVYAEDDHAGYLDFGFVATRPQIHDLAYSLSWIILRPDDQGNAHDFNWKLLGDLLAAYEEEARTSLTDLERRAVCPYLAAVPIYLAAVAGFTPDPPATLRGEVPFLRIAQWVLDNTPT